MSDFLRQAVGNDIIASGFHQVSHISICHLGTPQVVLALGIAP